MQTPNRFGVYPAEVTEELARKGHSFAAVDIAQCEDGLYRFALHYQTSHMGSGGPITRDGRGLPDPTGRQGCRDRRHASSLADRLARPIPTA